MGAIAAVTLQAGHAAWRSSSGTVYPARGGAPGEADWAWQLAHLAAEKLLPYGVATTVVGQWLDLPAPPEADLPSAIFVSLHYDAAVYGEGNNTGCFAGRATLDPSGALADRFIAGWSASYPAATGIPLHPERSNPNVTDYYAFRATPAEVPGVLIEHGCGSPVPTQGAPRGQDAALLHGQIGLVADADVAAIVAHLRERGYPLLEPDGGNTVSPEDQAILDVMHGLNANAASIEGWITTIAVQEQQIAALTAEVATLQQALADAPPPFDPYQHRTELVNTATGQRYGFVPER